MHNIEVFIISKICMVYFLLKVVWNIINDLSSSRVVILYG